MFLPLPAGNLSIDRQGTLLYYDFGCVRERERGLTAGGGLVSVLLNYMSA
jgi:hypothetical protein